MQLLHSIELPWGYNVQATGVDRVDLRQNTHETLPLHVCDRIFTARKNSRTVAFVSGGGCRGRVFFSSFFNF